MTDQKHIEAAAAAYDKEGGMHVGAASIHRLRAAITAYHASLAVEAGEAVCRWTFTPMGRVLRSPHKAGTTGDLFFPFKFCPDCGRRVEVA